MENYKKRVPKRRFKEFENDGEWILSLLKDYSKITMGQSPDSKNYYLYPKGSILVQGNADMKNGKVQPRVWTTQITKMATKGDIILSVRAPVGDVGKTDYNVVLGRGVAALQGNEFLYQNLLKKKLSNYWDNFTTGSTFGSINSNDIQNTYLSIPKIEEQNKIGTFFDTFDSQILLQQQKLDKLISLKEAYLAEMFPGEDETIPKRRFKEFKSDGIWDNYTIGEISEIFSGGTPAVGKQEFYDGEIPFIRSGEISLTKTELFISEKGLKNSSSKLVNKGDILYALYGATSGEVSISQIDGAINQAILAIKPKGNYNTNFITQWLAKQKMRITSEYLQGGQGNLSGAIVKELRILIPKNPLEQEKIGNLFLSFDKKISLQQQKLDKLKSLKEAYLNEMFV